jgi:hypothetical protein
MTAARQLGFDVVGATAGAILSDCGLYRYRLWRRWGRGRHALFCMLNPSTANADADDPTIRKCIGFAKRWDCDGIEVVNLFAWRATDPRNLGIAAYPVGPDNDEHITEAARAAPMIVAAWGARPQRMPDPIFKQRIARVRGLLGNSALCLGWTKLGLPKHPLMIAYDTELLSL